MSRIVLPPKYAGEKQSIAFDFASEIAANAPAETISSQVTTCSVYSGTDSSPSSVISGTGSISGAIVRQDITGGVAGVVYDLTCTATMSGSHTLIMNAFLVVMPALT